MQEQHAVICIIQTISPNNVINKNYNTAAFIKSKKIQHEQKWSETSKSFFVIYSRSVVAHIFKDKFRHS